MRSTLLLVIVLTTTNLLANEDGVLAWAWNDQIKPTIKHTWNADTKIILGTTTALTLLANAYDKNVYDHNERKRNLLFSDNDAKTLGVIGAGPVGVTIALAQLAFDTNNGLAHTRAIALTSLSHVTLAYLFRRERPGGRDDFLPFKSSFPSGHASSAFATATSLHLSYGLDVGVPAYLVASGIALARVSENTHWMSDAVAGAGLGVFWGVVSEKAKVDTKRFKFSFMPIIGPQGTALYGSINF